MKPKPLHPGEMVFFAIQPRFMNVDIRIVIDVTQGELNVFMSTHEDTYLAFPNSSIIMDDKYNPHYNGSRKTDDTILEMDASGLRTYITIKQPKTILTVRGLKDRLVITLPEVTNFCTCYFTLLSSNFFIALSRTPINSILSGPPGSRSSRKRQKGCLRYCVFTAGPTTHRSVCFLLSLLFLFLPVFGSLCSWLESKASG